MYAPNHPFPNSQLNAIVSPLSALRGQTIPNVQLFLASYGITSNVRLPALALLVQGICMLSTFQLQGTCLLSKYSPHGKKASRKFT